MPVKSTFLRNENENQTILYVPYEGNMRRL